MVQARRSPARLRGFPIRLLLILLLAVTTGLLGPVRADDAVDALRGRLSSAKADLAGIEAALAAPNVDEDALTRLRERLDADRAALQALQGDVAGPREASRARLAKIGDPPKEGQPPESADIAETRKREQALFGDLDGIGREAQVQVVRTDQLSNAIIEQRRDAFTRRITARTSSLLAPDFWTGFAADMPRFSWSLATVASDAAAYFISRLSLSSLATLVVVLAVAAGAALMLRRRVMRWRAALVASYHAPEAAPAAAAPVSPAGPTPGAPRGPSLRLAASLDILLGLVHAALGAPFAILMAVFALKLAGLAPLRLLDGMGLGLAGAIFAAVIYQTMGEGLLEEERPALRLLPLSDWAVRRIRRRVLWTSVVIGLYGAVLVVGRAVFAPVSFTVAITGLSSLLFALISTSLLIRLRRAPPSLDSDGRPVEDDVNKLDILRPMLWVVVIAIYASVLGGYIALAGFIAFFPLVLLFTAALAYTIMTVVDAGLTEGVLADPARSRAVASAVGVSARNIAFAATLMSGVLRCLVILTAVLAAAGPLGFYSSDMLSAVERAFFGFQIGEITIAPSSILLGIALFSVVFGIARLVRNWVLNTLLPRTRLDAGLQNSIGTIVGYIGIILAIAVGLSEVGLSLQNVAIVAGALSVGIGFGLQSIVSNFVSGLILLAERPIRVGDIVAAGGEEGFVRRISVRATEIETYDRATLIVPNSMLISGVVKNWVYGNTWSRVRVTVEVGYDADIEAVRATMRGAAEDDPRILPTPPPRVFLAKLGTAALEFELVAVVASVETLLAVRSDLHIRILKGFRERGIRVAAQLPAAPAPVVVSLDEALAAVGRPPLPEGDRPAP